MTDLTCEKGKYSLAAMHFPMASSLLLIKHCKTCFCPRPLETSSSTKSARPFVIRNAYALLSNTFPIHCLPAWARTGAAASPFRFVCSLGVRVFCDSVFRILSCPDHHVVCLVGSRQVAEVPVHQFTSDLGL